MECCVGSLECGACVKYSSQMPPHYPFLLSRTLAVELLLVRGTCCQKLAPTVSVFGDSVERSSVVHFFSKVCCVFIYCEDIPDNIPCLKFVSRVTLIYSIFCLKKWVCPDLMFPYCVYSDLFSFMTLTLDLVS